MRPRPFSLPSLSKKGLRLLPWLAMAGLLFYNLAFFIYRPSILNGTELGDFGSFIASGLAAQAGENPYGVYELTSRAEHQGVVVRFPNMNPPVALFLFEFLSLFHPVNLVRISFVISILIYLTGLTIVYRQYRPAPVWFGWALVLAGFWDTLVLGQVYTWLFFLAALAWLLLDQRHYAGAGILIGILAAVKPNLLLWPALLFVAGFRRPAIWSFAIALVLSLLPILRYGHQVYLQWFEAVSQAGWTSMPHYLSLFGLTARFGVPWLGLPLALLLLVFVAWWAWRRHPQILRTSAVGLVASILASPLATPRFTLLLIPVFYSKAKKRDISSPAALFLLPTSLLIWFGFKSDIYRVLLGLVYPLALIWMLRSELALPPNEGLGESIINPKESITNK